MPKRKEPSTPDTRHAPCAMLYPQDPEGAPKEIPVPIDFAPHPTPTWALVQSSFRFPENSVIRVLGDWSTGKAWNPEVHPKDLPLCRIDIDEDRCLEEIAVELAPENWYVVDEAIVDEEGRLNDRPANPMFPQHVGDVYVVRMVYNRITGDYAIIHHGEYDEQSDDGADAETSP